MFRSPKKSRCLPLIGATAMALLMLASSATAEVMYIVGTISGTVNDTYVEFGLHIKMDMETGEETAKITNMDPEMGAIMRQVTAMVTIAGPTGGGTPQGGLNLFELSHGNFVNSASMYWPGTRDSLELIHEVTYDGGDTMQVTATMNGTVPIIKAEDEVEFSDFSETIYWDRDCEGCDAESAKSGSNVSSQQTVTTGVGFRGNFGAAHGFRQYVVGGEPFPGGGGKGSTTTYNGPPSGSAIVRSARDITSTYSTEDRTMNVHLFNTLTPLESAPKK
ncbi:MAG: hypothetical protein K0U98_20490 [Deltaproteobacteria bacterium]|nr:hypothetical protein [Deltaproteobacteria bacterium]